MCWGLDTWPLALSLPLAYFSPWWVSCLQRTGELWALGSGIPRLPEVPRVRLTSPWWEAVRS